jgi:YesN/AraC family two-component response regulator
MMPVMNGRELLESIKANDKFRHIPMIMVTVHQSLEVEIDALRIGVDDYLTKPFREEELKVRIANLIKNSQSRNIPIEGIEVEEEEKEETPNISIKDLEWLKQLEVILLKNLTTKDFKLADIAPQLEVSYRHLRYKIKKITGLTLKQYQTSIRLAKAKDLLKSKEVKTVHEAMYQIGLENYYHFSKMYETEYGIKPSAELR